MDPGDNPTERSARWKPHTWSERTLRRKRIPNKPALDSNTPPTPAREGTHPIWSSPPITPPPPPTTPLKHPPDPSRAPHPSTIRLITIDTHVSNSHPTQPAVPGAGAGTARPTRRWPPWRSPHRPVSEINRAEPPFMAFWVRSTPSSTLRRGMVHHRPSPPLRPRFRRGCLAGFLFISPLRNPCTCRKVLRSSRAFGEGRMIMLLLAGFGMNGARKRSIRQGRLLGVLPSITRMEDPIMSSCRISLYMTHHVMSMVVLNKEV
mmetsp:Transcript_46405/g.68533  ORF Transcript_46405/g.68533 Transcript_46405/m.68533 type:complete len:262 (-) Transcript_46405:501-1286(-)